MAGSLIAMPSGSRQLTSIGTATGNRWAFLRSTFVPSGLVPRLAMVAGSFRHVRWLSSSPKQMGRSEGSLGQSLRNSYCTKGQYTGNEKSAGGPGQKDTVRGDLASIENAPLRENRHSACVIAQEQPHPR